MKPRSIIVIFVIVSLMLACNLPMVASQPENPPVSNQTVAAPVETQALAPATDTPNPAPDTSTVTPTPTLSAPTVTPIKDAVNCRFSADKPFESIASALAVRPSTPLLPKTSHHP